MGFSPRLLGWVLLGTLLISLLLSALAAPLVRNQEARVLETAREMVQGPTINWIVPRLNGHLRAQKPPLAYWMAAAAFEAGGVKRTGGRMPFILATLATVGLVMAVGRRWFGGWAGLAAGAMLGSSLIFAGYGYLAETDAITCLFVTGACVAICELADCAPGARAVKFSITAGLCIGLAGLSKGLPAGLALAFVIVLALTERNTRLIWDFVRLGGLPAAILIAAPWWLYIRQSAEARAIIEMEVSVLQGTDHGQPWWAVWVTPAMLIKMMLPWVLVAAGAVRWVIGNKPPANRSLTVDPVESPWHTVPIRRCLLWAGTIFVCLALLPQKQEHYLFPLMPPVMLLIGAFVGRGLQEHETRLAKSVGWLLALTTIAAMLAVPTILVLPSQNGRAWEPLDLMLAGLLELIFGIALLLYFIDIRRAALATFLAALLAMPLVLNVWSSTLRPPTFALIAEDIRREYADRPIAFYPIENYRIVFELGREIRFYETADALEAWARQAPNGLVIIEQPDKHVSAPRFLRLVGSYPYRGEEIRVYQVNIGGEK